MFYFLNDNIQENKSGIEHAQIKRLNLFNRYQVPAKIVTRQYSNNLHTVTSNAGIADDHFLNLYDYFQEAVSVESQNVQIQDLHLDASWKRAADGDNYNFTKDKQRMMYVRRYPNKNIMNLQYFDHFGKLLKVRWYDVRGFASVEQIYDWRGKITAENYLRVDGSIAIQKSHLLDRANEELISYHLFNYHGQDYQFADFAEFTRFFYDQIVTDEQLTNGEESALIVDRGHELAWSVLHMKQRVYRALQLHNNHANDSENMLHSSLNYNYEYSLNNITDWDAVICLTSQQTEDFTARFGKTGVAIFQIPGPIVPDELLNKKHIPFTQRQTNDVVVVARLAPEKQQQHVIEAWPQVLKAVPDAQLDLWGYAMGDTEDELKAEVQKLDVNKSVDFKGYTDDVGAVYDQAQLLILPSRAEGLPLTLVEAQSHGLPIIANDIKYGPADVVVDGKNGLLTQNGDIDGLAQAIISLLTDHDKLKKFSDQAYKDSARFSEPAVMEKWNQLIKASGQAEGKVGK